MNFQTLSSKKPRPYRHFPHDPEPAEWQGLDNVDWTGPVVIDVGAGSGDWVVAEAIAKPHTSFIAIERSKNRYTSLYKKIALSEPANVFAVRADAMALIQQKVPDKSVNAIYFFYPNPIPKKRQANKRYFVGSHFAVFHRVLKENGGLYLVSNIQAYIDESREYLAKIWEYEIVLCGQRAKDLPPRTAFEKKYQGRGEDLFELRAIKGNARPASWLPFVF